MARVQGHALRLSNLYWEFDLFHHHSLYSLSRGVNRNASSEALRDTMWLYHRPSTYDSVMAFATSPLAL